MSLRRFLAFTCALLISGAALTAQAEVANFRTSPTSIPSFAESSSAPATKLDDSHMTVVGSNSDLDRNIPRVDVANNSKLKKKPAPSFWSKLAHPSQWFSSGSKSKTSRKP